MVFHRSLCVLAVLANSPTGASAGNVAKRVGGYGCNLSKGQVARILKELVKDGYAISRREKYRPDIDTVLYTMTELAASAFSSIAREYSENEKQLTLPKAGEN